MKDRQRLFIPDDRYLTAPKLPNDRPPTRVEVWKHYHHYFHDTKTHEKIVIFCRDQWAYYYVRWINTKDWKCQPDWQAGDPIKPEGVPPAPVNGGVHSYYGFVMQYLTKAGGPTRAAKR